MVNGVFSKWARSLKNAKWIMGACICYLTISIVI